MNELNVYRQLRVVFFQMQEIRWWDLSVAPISTWGIATDPSNENRIYCNWYCMQFVLKFHFKHNKNRRKPFTLGKSFKRYFCFVVPYCGSVKVLRSFTKLKFDKRVPVNHIQEIPQFTVPHQCKKTFDKINSKVHFRLLFLYKI